jgi:hypothetical protein
MHGCGGATVLFDFIDSRADTFIKIYADNLCSVACSENAGGAADPAAGTGNNNAFFS